jgi:hypothetical protein
MKKHYLSWSRNSVDDKQIIMDLKKVSRGKLELKEEEIELTATKDIVNRNINSGNSKKKKPNNKRKRKSYKKRK